MKTPFTITLYNPDDTPRETFTKATLTWADMKKAITLSARMDEMGEAEQTESVYTFLVQFFGERFTVEVLEDCGDFSDAYNTFVEISTRAVQLIQSLGFRKAARATPPTQTTTPAR